MNVHNLSRETVFCFSCALNLEGGGSSTMVHEGVIKNTPRGDEDEEVSNFD